MPHDLKYEICTSSKEGAFIGGILGAAVGLFLGFFVDKLPLMPEVSHPWSVLLAVTLFGLFFGVASGVLIGIGTPEKVSRRFARNLMHGNILLLVRVNSPDEKDFAHEIFLETGGGEVVAEDQVETLREVLELHRASSLDEILHSRLAYP